MNWNSRALRLSWLFVGVVICCAAYAPLLAGELPVVAKSEDSSRWRLPAIRALSAADWLWIVAPILFALFYFWACAVRRRAVRSGRWMLLAAIVVAGGPVCVAGLRWWIGDPWLTSLKWNSASAMFVWIGLFVAGTGLSVIAFRRTMRSAVGTAMIGIVAVAALSISAAQLATVDRPILSPPVSQSDILLPTLIAHGPGAVELEHRNRPPGTRDSAGALHLLGTDAVGADVLARLVHGCRTALLVGVSAAVIGIGLGVLVGLIMGSFGGMVDLLLMRVVELFMAVPRLFLILAVVVFLPSRDSGVMLIAMVLIIGLTGWMRPARLMRGTVLRIRRSDYVLAAKTYGASRLSILLRHVLPNALGPVLVDAGFAVAAAILMETNLSFLGLGVQPPTASWGAMLSQAIDTSTGSFHWWMAIGPGVLIAGTVLACNSFSDAAREPFILAGNWRFGR